MLELLTYNSNIAKSKLCKSCRGILIVFLIFSLLTYCKKGPEEDTPEVSNEIEISFSGQQKDQTSLKNDQLQCYIENADYAKIIIDGIEYYPKVYYLEINGEINTYTQSIKLPYNQGSTNEFTVEQFLLMSENQTPDNTSDDVIIAATPESGSDYAAYVNKPVNFSISVLEFDKIEVPVEVVCFEADIWESFGFDWFGVTQIAILEQCFFGDLCSQNPNNYIGSFYELQSGPLQMDMPAIFLIEVYRNGSYEGSFSNENWLGEGQPLCIQYKDYLYQTDLFEFLLYVYISDGSIFSYKYLHYWSFYDDAEISQGSDGIVDFSVGPCSPSADFVLPTIMNIPSIAKLKIRNFAPGSPNEGYIDVRIYNIPSGYDIITGKYAAWTLDHSIAVIPDNVYNTEVYSSLYFQLGPNYLENEQWDKINWIMNHLDWYPGYSWEDIQGAFWLLNLQNPWSGESTGGIQSLSNLQYAEQMKIDADNYGAGYEPIWGEKAAVVFVEENTPPSAANPNLYIVFVELIN